MSKHVTSTATALPLGSTFKPTRFASRGIVVAMSVAAIARLATAVEALSIGDLEPSTAYGFSVIFPFVLITLILSLGPSLTREGVLMRLGTSLQLILVIAIPRFALHLVLGLPVVFLGVELFETRLPKAMRNAIAKRLVRC